MEKKEIKLGGPIILAAIAAMGVNFSITMAHAQQRIISTGETSSMKQGSTMTTDKLQQRGKQLRAEIERVYKEMVQSHTLVSGQNILNNKVISQYIPDGTSFEDAKEIMDAAGLNPQTKKLTPQTMGLVGWATLDRQPSQFTTVDVGVSVESQNPNDFHSGMCKAGAAIFASNL